VGIAMRRWFVLPLLIGAAAILAPPALLLYDRVIGLPAWPPLEPLHGVTQPVTPALSVGALLSGTYQSQVATGLSAWLPIYALSVQLKNELLFRLFHVAGVPGILVGPKGDLVESFYAVEVCRRDPAAFRPVAAAFLPRLRQIQDIVEARGKRFVYVISPSKPAMDPGALPKRLHCPASFAARAETSNLWGQMLEAAGVHTVDAPILLAAAAPRYPFDFFPPGGTHWNHVGSALATQAAVAAINASGPAPLLPPFEFTWAMSHDPRGEDRDLAELMNLLWPRVNYAVPQVSVRNDAPGVACRPVHVTIIGDSFMHQVAEHLMNGPCHPEVDMWGSWRVTHMTWHWPQSFWVMAPMDPDMRARSLRDADVIIFEENDSATARSGYGALLYDFLTAQSDGRPAAPPQ
jgi:alginate O-acetyltransferase complex protein AlgJ